MGKLYVIGEMLIDFTARECAAAEEVRTFEKNAGGAPANVAVCAARLGARSAVITKLGKDAFGRFLRKTLTDEGVDTQYVFETDEVHTALAFVFLDEAGEREFLFYRDPSADLLLDEREVSGIPFKQGDILHFGSVDLVNYPVKRATERAIERARAAGALVSFDPNLRYPLWKSREELLSTVRNFLPMADIVKVSEEELSDITGIREQTQAARILLHGNTKAVFVTAGADGAAVYTGSAYAAMPSEKAVCVDATGAGDTFAGTILYQFLRDGLRDASTLTEDRMKEYLYYANRAAAVTVSGRGAIPSMPFAGQIF